MDIDISWIRKKKMRDGHNKKVLQFKICQWLGNSLTILGNWEGWNCPQIFQWNMLQFACRWPFLLGRNFNFPELASLYIVPDRNPGLNLISGGSNEVSYDTRKLLWTSSGLLPSIICNNLNKDRRDFIFMEAISRAFDISICVQA